MLKLKSNYGIIRYLEKIDDNTIKFTSYDTLYYTGTGNNIDDLDSIDPDGGPCICKNSIIKLGTEEFKIQKFTNIIYDEIKEYLEFLKQVKKYNKN